MANLTLIEAMTKTADLVYEKVKTLLGNKVDKVQGKGLSTNDYTTTEKQKLEGIEEGAEVNQNAFSKVNVGNKTITADKVSDILKLFAGENIIIEVDDTNKTVTFKAKPGTDRVPLATTEGTASAYTITASSDVNCVAVKFHVANAANATLKISNLPMSSALPIYYKGSKLVANQIPANATVLLARNDTDEAWEMIYSVDTNTTYKDATASASGLMSKSDKTKLDAFKSASEYALKSDITGVYTYKGSVATYAELPSTHANGDVWDVKSDGKNYAWNGTEWDDLGGVIIIDETTLTSAINTVLAN